MDDYSIGFHYMNTTKDRTLRDRQSENGKKMRKQVSITTQDFFGQAKPQKQVFKNTATVNEEHLTDDAKRLHEKAV